MIADDARKTSDGERKARERAKTRDLVVPEILNPKRRKKAESDDCLWLKTYCGDVFYNDFTPYHRQLIKDAGEALKYGTNKCKAAPRGDGKSSIIKYLALKYLLERKLKFALLVAATGKKAKKILDSIKRRLAAKKASPLSEDYPLECTVARYVSPAPSRCNNVTANGERPIKVEWSPHHIILPTWETEEPVGPILMALGITSEDLQGCNVYDVRPDFVMLDDLDNRDSLAAADGVIAAKIEEAIDKTISGMRGQSKRLGIFMLCTITSRKSAAFKYSDPSLKPAFAGERIAALIKWPERDDLWNQYILLRQAGASEKGPDGRPRDPLGREAHAFYLKNRAAMDAGAELSNPYNFEASPLPDGSTKQVSALQRCYDYIADWGLAAFQTEYQNDPPEEHGPIESGITAHRIQVKVCGLPRKLVPLGAVRLSQGIDCRKIALHWVVRAWVPDGPEGFCTGYTIDYGVTEVRGTTVGSDVGLDEAMKRALDERRQQMIDNPYTTQDEASVPITTLVDAGWRTEAIYEWTSNAGIDFKPCMGAGKSSGTVSKHFAMPVRNTADKKVGDQYYLTRRPKGVMLVYINVDDWKTWEHDRWMDPADQPGTLLLFGEKPTAAVLQKNSHAISLDQKAHMSYAKHVTAEVEVETPDKDGVLIRGWKTKSDTNHYLDGSVYANVGASLGGVKLRGRRSARVVVTAANAGSWLNQANRR